MPSLPRLDTARIARVAVVVAGAALVLWALFATVRAVYRATMTPPAQDRPEPAQEVPAAPAEQPPPDAGKGPRTPQSIPPLYID